MPTSTLNIAVNTESILGCLQELARLASQMRSLLYVLYVSNSDRFLTREESLYLETCEKLCEQFGGEFIRVNNNITQAIAKTAKKYFIALRIKVRTE